MAKRRSADKFRVGQTVMLVTTKETGWGIAYGRTGVIVEQRRYGTWSCGSLDGSRGPGEDTGWRYAVRTWRGINHFEENHLRAMYDGEKLSTWEKFAKVTGLRLDKELVPIPFKRPTKRRVPESEARDA